LREKRRVSKHSTPSTSACVSLFRFSIVTCSIYAALMGRGYSLSVAKKTTLLWVELYFFGFVTLKGMVSSAREKVSRRITEIANASEMSRCLTRRAWNKCLSLWWLSWKVIIEPTIACSFDCYSLIKQSEQYNMELTCSILLPRGN